MKKSISISLAMALIASLASAAVETGKPAPDFTGVNDLGETVRLSDLKGQTVILEWLNHGCPFVRKFYAPGEMQRLQKSKVEQGAVWIAVVSSAKGKQGYMTPEESVSTREANGSHVSHVIMDNDGTIGRLYDARTTPQMFVIDKEGILVYQGAIDSKSTTSQADIANAENYVVKAFQALKAGEPIDPHTTRPYGCSVKY